MLLVGPTNNGKTMIVEKFRRDHPQKLFGTPDHSSSHTRLCHTLRTAQALFPLLKKRTAAMKLRSKAYPRDKTGGAARAQRLPRTPMVK